MISEICIYNHFADLPGIATAKTILSSQKPFQFSRTNLDVLWDCKALENCDML